MFEDVEVALNFKTVDGCNKMYQHESYLKLLLFSTEQERKTRLANMMYYLDQPGNMSAVLNLAETTPGQKLRYSMVDKSDIVELSGKYVPHSLTACISSMTLQFQDRLCVTY